MCDDEKESPCVREAKAIVDAFQKAHPGKRIDLSEGEMNLVETKTMSFTIHPFDPEKLPQELQGINEYLAAERKRRLPSKLIEVDSYYAPVIQNALAKRLKEVTAELKLLRLARERDLTKIERWQLPSNLQQLSQEQLAEQVDPWISLRDTIDGLIKEFDFKDVQ